MVIGGVRERLATYTPRLTGRWAISWQVIVFGNLVTYPQMVLTGGTLGSRQMTPEELPTSAAVMGVAVLANAAYGFLAMATVFRNRARRPVPLWLYVAFYLSAGVIPVLAMEYLDSVLGEQTALPVGLRLFFASLTTLWLGAVFSLLLDGRDRFRRERSELLADAIEMRSATLGEEQAFVELRTQVDSMVDERLADARRELDEVWVDSSGILSSGETADGDRPWDSVVAVLEDTARDAVRPLSHELWDEAERSHGRPRFGRVFAELWRDPRFLPWNTALITAISLPGASVRGFGSWAPVALVGVTVAAGLVLSGANRVIGSCRSVGAKRVSYVAGLIVLLLVIEAYGLIPGEVTAVAQDGGSILIALVFAVIAVSYVGALGDVRKQILASLESDVIQEHIDAEARRTEMARLTRKVARSLHGSVQTRLIACAAAMDQAQRNGEPEAIIAALSESRRVLENWESAGEGAMEQPLHAELDQLIENWRAVCLVDLNLESDLAVRTDLTAAARIVEEAIANAFRHGMASEIRVSISSCDEGVAIEVRDDGAGPTGNPLGLGRRLIDEYCKDQHSLERVGSATVLTAILPTDR